ncbi:MAG: sulfurtransferase TusA family protein [Acidisphaera sp.]|nr:sulfurtransferase TusA family protein [Acidisphaera sp.]
MDSCADNIRPSSVNDNSADRVLDITGELCPMTFVRTRLALDGLAPGQLLLVLLRGEEPRSNVPRTAAAQGHAIISEETDADGVTRLLLRRA